MFELEVYFDDSGTDGMTPVAVAACYLSSKSQWDQFVRNWDEVRTQEGFDEFHMAHFVAKTGAGHKPFCDWSNEKKDRVYARLASIINCRVHKGFAIAVPKRPFDDYAFAEFKAECAKDHYTWAVKSVIGLIENYRKKFAITVPMQYVFDRGSLGQTQIEAVWKNCNLHDGSGEKYGIVPERVMFQDKAIFKPLQAADILAWQMQNHMRRTVMIGLDPNDLRYVHKGFRVLRDNRPMDIGFYSTEQLRVNFEQTKAFHAEHGIWPWTPNFISGKLKRRTLA
jgi:Protein of unknown function (DUF3800)